MRTILFILIVFVGVTSIAGGLLMVAYPLGTALGLSLDLLRPTVLNDFFIPGIILLVVGGVNMAAVFAGMQRSLNQYNWAIAGGLTVSIWIITEAVMIQVVHWLQPIYLITGVLIILIAYQLKGKWAA